MGRAPCCGDHEGLKRGPWTAEEDQNLINCVQTHGHGNWRNLPKLAGLSRCGKSCRLRWANYLRPDIKRGEFSMADDLTIIRLHAVLGNKWSGIASHLPGRTDNEIKNHWNTKLRKRLLLMGIDPVTHNSLPRPDMVSSFMAARLNSALLEAQLGRLARDLVNTSNVAGGSVDQQYSWQLCEILNLLGAHNNPLSAGPSGSLSCISADEFLQPDALRWPHGFQNKINQGFVSMQKNDSIEYNTFSQESLQSSDPQENSKGKNLTINTDRGNEHRTASSLIEERSSAFDTEITGWNPMAILMPSSNPHQNHHPYFYSDKNSSSNTSTNSYRGESEIMENTIQYHQDDPFGSAIRGSHSMSVPAARVELKEEESNYWADLLNSIEDSEHAFPLASA